jgi:hypothetical protein
MLKILKDFFKRFHDFQEFLIRELVVYLRTFPATPEVAVHFQVFELLGNIGLFSANHLLNFTDASFAFAENAEDPQAGYIRHSLQEWYDFFAFFDFIFNVGLHDFYPPCRLSLLPFEVFSL